MSHRTLWKTLSGAGLALAALTGCDDPAADVQQGVDKVQEGVDKGVDEVQEGVDEIQDGDDDKG